MDVFEFRTGKFTPLTDDVLAKFNDEQRSSYDELKSAITKLDGAKGEAAAAIDANRSAVSTLHAAEAAEAKKPKYTFLDALRDSQQQYRKDHP